MKPQRLLYFLLGFLSVSLAYLLLRGLLVKGVPPQEPSPRAPEERAEETKQKTTPASEPAPGGRRVEAPPASPGVYPRGPGYTGLRDPVAAEAKKESHIEEKESLSGDQLIALDLQAYVDINRSLSPDSEAATQMETCIKELSRRLPKETTGLGQFYRWHVILSISASDGLARITEVKLAEEERWPPYFDQEAIDCYLNSLRDFEMETGQVFEYHIKFPLCITP